MGGGCRGSEGGRWRATLGRCFWPAVRALSESPRCWLKINWAAGAAARVGPDSCARTANMDAHQVPAAGRCGVRGGSRWELVGRAGSSGRGKERRKGRRRRGRRRSGPARCPRGEGCPAHPGPAPPPERTQRGVGRSGPRLRETASLKSTKRSADFTLLLIPKSSLKGCSRSAPDISLPPESRQPEPGARTYGWAGLLAPRHDAVGTGGLREENEERCKLVPEKESKWRFWMCKVHQLRSHFPSSSSPTGREVGEELATPAPQPSSRPPPRPPAQLPRPHARRLALPLSP